jgi:hypothetical protein
MFWSRNYAIVLNNHLISAEHDTVVAHPRLAVPNLIDGRHCLNWFLACPRQHHRPFGQAPAPSARTVVEHQPACAPVATATDLRRLQLGGRGLSRLAADGDGVGAVDRQFWIGEDCLEAALVEVGDHRALLAQPFGQRLHLRRRRNRPAGYVRHRAIESLLLLLDDQFHRPDKVQIDLHAAIVDDHVEQPDRALAL